MSRCKTRISQLFCSYFCQEINISASLVLTKKKKNLLPNEPYYMPDAATSNLFNFAHINGYCL